MWLKKEEKKGIMTFDDFDAPEHLVPQSQSSWEFVGPSMGH